MQNTDINLNKTYKNEFFNTNRLFNYVKSFCFPRLAGTDGEKKAVEKTIHTFKEIGFESNKIQKKTFEFSDFYSTTLIKLIMSINLIFNLVLLLFTYIHIYLSIFMILIMIITFYLIIRGLKHPENPGFWGEYFGDNFTATNVFTKIIARSISEKDAGNIIISAHIDSKSQTFKTYWRIFFYRVWMFSGISLGLFYTIFFIIIFGNLNFDLRVTFFGTLISIILISISNIFLMFLNTHNKSPGALDNASGMAIVFELSSYFLKNPLDNFNIWFCQFSAEELGTMGSRVFVNDHEDQFIKRKTFQINFDMVSCGCHKKNRIEYFKSYRVIPRKKIAPLLSKYIELAANEEKLKIRGFHLSTGSHTDTVPFHLRKFDAIDIITKAGAIYSHTKYDTLDKIDPIKLNETCKIVRKTILMIDNDYDILSRNQKLICD